MRIIATLLHGMLLAALSVTPAEAERIAVANVTIIDVETGAQRVKQTLIARDGKIRKVGSANSIRIPGDFEVIDGSGKFLIPGLWDMHVHSHREERWKYHYPLYIRYGITGIRDPGSHLGSSIAAMQRAANDPLAPHVVWGSPTIDGAPPVNSFGLVAEDADSGRALVRQMKHAGFSFIKVYDRLTPAAYYAITDEANELGLRIEGHVPLSLSPVETTASGQTLIEHLTLVLESCVPGTLDWVHEEFATNPRSSESLELIMDGRLAAALDQYDVSACGKLFQTFAEHRVWQVPTLIEMHGYFHADENRLIVDPRNRLTTPGIVADWHDWSETADRQKLQNGKDVLVAQMAMIRAMQDAGVRFLAGTDASNEPYVYAGASLHDELALLVDAGLTPLESLQTATINPLLYLGREKATLLMDKSEAADLVLLNANPLENIRNTLSIEGVVYHGSYFDRAELDAQMSQAINEAAKGRL